jgi:hypothetical protein
MKTDALKGTGPCLQIVVDTFWTINFRNSFAARQSRKIDRLLQIFPAAPSCIEGSKLASGRGERVDTSQGPVLPYFYSFQWIRSLGTGEPARREGMTTDICPGSWYKTVDTQLDASRG